MQSAACTTTDGAADPAKLTDRELLRLVLTGHQAAWREFVERFDTTIRLRITQVVLGCTDGLPASNTIDDLLGDFYLALLDRNMHKLRVYSPRKGRSLRSWLCLLATRLALDFVREPKLRAYSVDDFVDAEELGEALDGCATNRGGAWIAWWS